MNLPTPLSRLTIRLSRPWAWFGGGRLYEVLVDGKVYGTVAAGRTLVLPWPAGARLLTVALDGCVSPGLPISPEETGERFFSVVTAFWPLAMFASLVAPDKVLALRETWEKPGPSA
jgi:hypothetical protein